LWERRPRRDFFINLAACLFHLPEDVRPFLFQLPDIVLDRVHGCGVRLVPVTLVVRRHGPQDGLFVLSGPDPLQAYR
jgi:hypothetical protein